MCVSTVVCVGKVTPPLNLTFPPVGLKANRHYFSLNVSYNQNLCSVDIKEMARYGYRLEGVRYGVGFSRIRRWRVFKKELYEMRVVAKREKNQVKERMINSS